MIRAGPWIAVLIAAAIVAPSVYGGTANMIGSLFTISSITPPAAMNGEQSSGLALLVVIWLAFGYRCQF
jgi:hypothetical protein